MAAAKALIAGAAMMLALVAGASPAHAALGFYPVGEEGYDALDHDDVGTVVATYNPRYSYQGYSLEIHRSTDAGRTWGEPTELPWVSLGIAIVKRIGPNQWMVSRGNSLWKSDDNGTSWTLPIAPQFDISSIAADLNGHVVLASRWAEYVASSDYGATWTPTGFLNPFHDSAPGLDTSPNVAISPTGAGLAVWSSNRNIGGLLGDDYDLFSARSVDFGATWTVAAPLNADAAVDRTADDYGDMECDLNLNCIVDSPRADWKTSNAGVSWTPVAPTADAPSFARYQHIEGVSP